MIWLLPYARGGTMPVDPDLDPGGALLGVGVRGQRGVRLLSDAELAAAPPGPRFNPHWTSCPHAAQYRTQARRQAPDTFPRRDVRPGGRAGPCARCGNRFPNRYGPDATVMCPACQPQATIPPVS